MTHSGHLQLAPFVRWAELRDR